MLVLMEYQVLMWSTTMNNLDSDSYYALKKKEIDFLNSFLTSKQVIKSYTLDNIISAKDKIRSRMISKFYDYNYYTLPTNKNEKQYRINNIKYTYNYQRYDINIKVDNFFNRLYGIGYLPSLYIFTNCGMSSIYSILSALNLTGKFSMEFNDDIYFETYKLIMQKNFYNISRYKYNKICFSTRILFLDTISIEDTVKNLNLKNITGYFAVIIDTTCFFTEGFKKIIDYIISKGVVCILLRSHTKLDMLSTEFSKLGSVLYILPQELPSNRFDTLKNIIHNTKQTLAAIGGFAYPEDIPPFWSSKDFFNLNKARVSRIKRNHVTISNILMSSLKNAEVVLPDHQTFLLICSRKKYSKDELKQKLYSIIKEKKLSNIPIYFAGGFGFDFISLDTYYDVIRNENLIRISIPDYTNKLTKYISYILLDKLNDIL